MRNPGFTSKDHTLEVLIPDRDRDGTWIDVSSAVNELKSNIKQHLGGLSRRPEDGEWISETGKEISERNIVLSVSFDKTQLPEFAGTLLRFAALAAEALNQEAVAIRVDGKMVIASMTKSELV